MRSCSQPGCVNPSYSRGLCKRHYKHAQYRGTLEDHPLSDRDVPTPMWCDCAFPAPRPVVAFGVEFTDVFECVRCRRAVLTREESRERHPSNRS